MSLHNHVADVSKIGKLKGVEKVKCDSIENPSMKTRTAFHDMSNTMDNTDDVMPIKYDTMSRAMARVRSKNMQRPKAPVTFGDVIKYFPDELKVLSDGSDFFLYG